MACNMPRPIQVRCPTCEKLMTRCYVRPTGDRFIGIGHVCECGQIVWDDGRKVPQKEPTPFDRAWAHILKRGEQ